MVAVALLACAVMPVSGQEVRGRLLDGVTRQAIVLGKVALVDTANTVVDEVFTDGEGNFVVNAGRAGRFFVAAGRSGYASWRGGPVDLDSGTALTVEITLRPEGVRTGTPDPALRRQQLERHLESVGFYQRLGEGTAWFLTPQDLEKTANVRLSQLLGSAPGATSIDQGLAAAVTFRTAEDAVCTPRVLLNGVEADVARPGGEPGALIDRVVQGRTLAGIEVHGENASLPEAYRGTGTCSTILIWTRPAG